MLDLLDDCVNLSGPVWHRERRLLLLTLLWLLLILLLLDRLALSIDRVRLGIFTLRILKQKLKRLTSVNVVAHLAAEAISLTHIALFDVVLGGLVDQVLKLLHCVLVRGRDMHILHFKTKVTLTNEALLALVDLLNEHGVQNN